MAGVKINRESNRELELGQIIEGIYKLFGEINSHLKKVLDPQQSKGKFYIYKYSKLIIIKT